MSYAAKTLFVFGLYMLALGTTVILVPNVLLLLFHLPTTDEVWIRVVGMLVIILGIYDIIAALEELEPLILWSIPLRSSVIILFAVFVITGLATHTLLLFGVIDTAGAIWTWSALRKAYL